MRILTALSDRIADSRFADRPWYSVPGLWVDPNGSVAARKVTPELFFRDRLLAILESPVQALVTGTTGPGDWGQHAVAYNLFIRAGGGWDHDEDGRIALTPLGAGWRETGTFLKAITFLPFIRSLGCNTVHLLPVTAIGKDGHKGNLGSPFAIRDPYALDEALSEPALDLGAGVEFAAFVEAAHHLGLRVVVEFVFRTAAKDAVWAAEHPEWFYWIRADVADRKPGEVSEDIFGAPLFTPAELDRIYQQVGAGQYADLTPPHTVYRRMFLPPPAAGDVKLVDGQWLGRTRDPKTAAWIDARIPGAFCDWTPDSDQPPWTDVTYLRLYDHPDFNYMAYNTVRIYDERLAQPAHAVTGLWDKITEIIPHWQRAYAIDGVMIDMGHALPPALKQHIVMRARAVNADFALWAEDFDLKASSRAEGYSVCLGPFMQTVRNPVGLGAWLRHLHRTGVPVPFMATPENHNTPRAVTWPGGRRYAAYAMRIGSLLPAVPYVHGGLELAEAHPINTGFDFTPEQLAALPAEVLPLFSATAYGWTRLPNLVGEIRAILAERRRYEPLVVEPGAEAIDFVKNDNPHVVLFVRGKPGAPRLLVICNSDMSNPQTVDLVVSEGALALRDLLARCVMREGDASRCVLEPGEVRVWELA